MLRQAQKLQFRQNMSTGASPSAAMQSGQAESDPSASVAQIVQDQVVLRESLFVAVDDKDRIPRVAGATG